MPPTDVTDLKLQEQQKVLELFESVALLLQSSLVPLIDKDTFEQLSQMHDIVQSWVQGNSTLTHEQMLTAISNLTISLNRDKTILVSESSKSVH